jgi:hypothetical protein
MLCKLVRNTKKNALLKLRNSKTDTVRHSQEAILLAHSAQSISRSLELNIYKEAFSMLKKGMMASFKASKEVLITPAETKEKVAKLLNNFVTNKAKDALTMLKKKSWEQDQLSSVHQSRKMTPLKTSQEKAKKQYHQQPLISLNIISKAYYSSHLRKAFTKIQLKSIASQRNVN